MAKSKRHVKAAELDRLIESATTLTPGSYTLRNALMELRGLRAVHAMCNPSVWVSQTGDKLLFYDRDDDEWQK